MTKNQIDYQTMLELRRSNLAKEAETNRSNVAKENETFRSNVARETETNRNNLATEALGFANLRESERSNRAREAENYRSNVAREQETTRANKAKESETQRNNLQQAYDRWDALKETKRYNDLNAALGWANVSATRDSTSSRERTERYKAILNFLQGTEHDATRLLSGWS